MNYTTFKRWATGLALGASMGLDAQAFTPSTQPPDTVAVPGNVLLALSVEFPTGLQVSYTATTYVPLTAYEGYFDNKKCYTYSTLNEVFNPASKMNADATCPVATQWSGNLLNWLTMTNVDQFRSVMTGGTRDSFSSMSGAYAGDTTTRTVLIRSFSDRNSYNPIKDLTVGTAGMPLTGVNKKARSGGYGSKLIVSNANNFLDMATQADRSATCAATPLPGAAGTSWCFNIRVETCVAVTGQGIDANCQNKYSGVPKPEGLIQDYSTTLRFGAMGYLNETGNARSGGVVRSAMKSVGAMAATATAPIANAAKEWSETSGVMYVNPDPTDATASGVANSGLMNYLNKFGYAAGYKGNDPVGELYYAGQLYLRGVAPPASYSDSLTAAGKDGFPVINSNLLAGQSRDPIINTCQKNFILGIGDIYTHCDGNLPGSTKGLACVGGTPVDAAGLNVQSLWDITRGYEGLADNGWIGGASNGTPYMAGLAHWANTNDIRPDLAGTQNIRTYWVDVLENTNGAATVALASLRKTQFWLAAKYGGFKTDLVAGNNPNTVTASWDANGDGIPDSWYAGSTPTTMKQGLKDAFASIAVESQSNSASSAAVTSNRQTSNSQILYAGYDPKGWKGNVRSCYTTQSAADCNTTPAWEASQWFKTSAGHPAYVTTPLTHNTRKIFASWKDTTTPYALTTMPFLWGSLNSDQQLILNAADTNGSLRVDYLRGDRSNETTLFHARDELLLGDIVNSGVTYLSGAGPVLIGSKFPGHSTYRATNKTRPPVVYVGANDGMLHAFSGADGKELFGYIPGAVFNNLPSLTTPAFQHRFFVDGTPMVGDIQTSATTWGTFLVGGLGGGGKGYYALDITGQSGFAAATEATLAALPKWEFTSVQDADLGYTFNEPSVNPLTGAHMQIAKVADSATGSLGEWRVIVGNGYGSAAGKAILFMLDATSGTVSAPNKLIADAGPINGLSAPTPVDTDRDGLVDTIYAGDLLGNLHKFQFSKLNVSATDYVRAPNGDNGGAWRYLGKVLATGEPIVTAPSVTPACDGAGWEVAFGTGKLNEDPDFTDTSARGFYAVVDKNPSSALTVANTNLATIAIVSPTPSTRTWTTPNLSAATNRGWKMGFTGGERVLSNSTMPPDTGVVLFGTTKPNGNMCAPGNTGFVMAVNLCSGKTGDLIVAGTEVGGVAINSTGIVKVSNTYTDSNNQQKVVCNQDDCKGPTGPTLKGSAAPKGRYSWRELFSK